MSNQPTYRAAVIGLGQIGLGYDLTSTPDQVFTHTKAIMAHPGFELVGGVDLDSLKRESFERFSGAPSYSSIDELCSKAKPEVVAIATSAAQRREVIERVCSYGPRLLLIEKPVATSFAESEEIACIMRKHVVRGVVNYVRLFDPAARRFAQQLRSGTYGRVLNVQVTYSKGLFNNGSHYLSLCLSWFGQPDEGQLLRRRECAELRTDLEADFVLRFPEFLVSFMACDERCYSIGEINVFLEKARFQYLSFGERAQLASVVVDPAFPSIKTLVAEPFKVAPQMQRYQYNVYERIHAELSGAVTHEESFRLAQQTLQLCEQISKQEEVF